MVPLTSFVRQLYLVNEGISFKHFVDTKDEMGLVLFDKSVGSLFVRDCSMAGSLD